MPNDGGRPDPNHPSNLAVHDFGPGRAESLQLLESVAMRTRYRSGEEICAEEGEGALWYRLVAGVGRRYAVRPSGRRQIVGLLLPGDLFGFPSRGEHAFSVEAAVDPTVVACYPRRRIEQLADSDPRVARAMREMAFEAIARLEEQIFILGRTTALKKVGSFLSKVAERMSGGGEGRIVLPISRYDIADYLGLSVETVSRCLTGLKERGIIRLSGPRRVSIVDREALEAGCLTCGADWDALAGARSGADCFSGFAEARGA
jgi:CRP/FNR family nitrogen fixation transcriptional regulator